MINLRQLFFYFSYFSNPPWDTGISPPELLDFIRTNPPGKALDLGCGTGTNVVTLAKHSWWVTGVDYAYPAIRLAKKKIKNESLNAILLVDDVTRLDKVKDLFDLILDIGCLHSVNKKKVITYSHNVSKLLNKNGTYLLYGLINQQIHAIGLSEFHLNALSEVLNLVERKDSKDKDRASAWFKYRQRA